MFSSNRLILSSTNLYSPCNSFFDDENDDVYSNNPQRNGDPFISGEFLYHSYTTPTPLPPPVVAEDVSTVTTLKQDFVTQQQFSQGSGNLHNCEDHEDILDSVNYRYKKKMETSKKDGHSKIYTAQGPRDRRVRLSIEIARKFFCLQDLLGFDKASKTLDWLLTKSMAAIKDLVEETNHCSSSTLTEQSEVKLLETIKVSGSDEDDDRQKKKSVIPKCVDGKKKKITPRFKAKFRENVARDQSRAEARARARERTKEKMRLKNLFDESQSDYNHFRWESIMDQESLNQSKDSSFQQGDHGIHVSDLDKKFKIVRRKPLEDVDGSLVINGL